MAKRVYNEHFLYPDPLSASVASRTTRYRRKRERCEQSETTAQAENDSVSDICDNNIDNVEDVPDMPLTDIQHRETESVYSVDSDHNEPEDLDEPPVSESTYLLEEFYAPYTEEIIDYSMTDEASYIDLEDHEGIETETDHSVPCTLQANDGLLSEPGVVSSDYPLFNGCPLSLSSSTLLIKKFQMRHGISQEALSDMLQLMKLHFPTENNFPGTIHLFNKHLPFHTDALEFVYFCSCCFCEISDKEDVDCCEHCKKPLNIKGSISSFIEVPLETQLITILQSKLYYFYM